MKIFTNKKVVQKVIIAIIIVLSFNFIVPNFSQAVGAGEIGGVLLGPAIDLIASVGDAVLAALQFFMVDGNTSIGGTIGGAISGVGSMIFNNFTEDVERFVTIGPSYYGMEAVDNPETQSTDESQADIIVYENELDTGWFWLGTYQIPTIKYTPEKIFSNQVPALDANFINPTNWEEQYGEDEGAIMNDKSVAQLLHSTVANWYVALRNLAIVALLSVLIYVGIRMVISSTSSDKAKYKQMLMDWVVALCIVFFLHYLMSFILTLTGIITQGLADASTIVVEIQKSAGNDEVVTKFATNLTGLCRLQLQYSDLGTRAIYLFFYLALVIYTAMFTWTYIKRAITMAFLTLMAPLVAITYPIDKISDGKAQAFGIWLKEFIFNSLVQPFHLIIYTIFLGASSEIAVKNPIYAILFLAFILPAEKLLRSMFGFEKSSTASSMGAAAGMLGGAALLNSAKGALGKAGKGKGSASGSGVRTKKTNGSPNKAPSFANSFGGGGALPAGGSEGEGSPASGDPGGGGSPASSGSPASGGPGGGGSLASSGSPALGGAGGNGSTPPIQSQTTQSRNRNMQRGSSNGRTWSEDDTRGMGQWIGDNLNRTRFGRNLSNGAKAVKNFPKALGNIPNAITNAPGIRKLPKPIRNTIRGAVGTVGKGVIGAAKFAGKAAVGATVGALAGVAGGDLDDVLKGTMAGAAFGVTGLPIVGQAISGAAGSLRDTYEQQAFGKAGAIERANTRELMKDEEYEGKCADYLAEELGREPTDTEVQEMMMQGATYYNTGIDDFDSIIKAVELENDLKGQFTQSGMGEQEASERARNQAKTVAHWASQYSTDKLLDEKNVTNLRNQVVRQLVKKSGMDSATAEAQAEHVINLIKQQKGIE